MSGFNVNRFIVDATDFWPSLDGGLFSVNVDDNNLNLIFTTGSGIPVWDGEGEDANWDTGINWEGDIAPMGEKVVYFYTGLYSGPTIQLNGIRSVRGLRLTDQADESLTFAGTRLNINSAGIAIDANSEGAHALACMVQLSADQTWTNDSALPFTARGMISGAQQLRKAGSGLVVLAANNTFSGGLYVDQGGVQLHSSTNYITIIDNYILPIRKDTITAASGLHSAWHCSRLRCVHCGSYCRKKETLCPLYKASAPESCTVWT